MSRLAGLYGPEGFSYPSGSPAAQQPVSVYLPGTTNLATLYTDENRTSQAANPGQTDDNGDFSFYAEPGFYDLSIAGVTYRVNVQYSGNEFDTAAYKDVTQTFTRTQDFAPDRDEPVHKLHRQAAGQVANLAEYYDETGTLIAYVGPDFSLNFPAASVAGSPVLTEASQASGAYDPAGAADTAVANHAAAADPHAVYATDADLANHGAAADPHPVYTTDAEAQSKVDTHAAAQDPHPVYTTDTEVQAKVNAHNVASGVHGVGSSSVESTSGSQAKVDAHANGTDPHPGYALKTQVPTLEELLYAVYAPVFSPSGGGAGVNSISAVFWVSLMIAPIPMLIQSIDCVWDNYDLAQDAANYWTATVRKRAAGGGTWSDMATRSTQSNSQYTNGPIAHDVSWNFDSAVWSTRSLAKGDKIQLRFTPSGAPAAMSSPLLVIVRYSPQ